MKKRNLFLFIFGFTLLKLFADDPEPDQNTLKTFKNVLKMEIEVNLIQGAEKVAWNSKGFKYTIPGRAVIVKIEGNNMRMYGSFTPYYDTKGSLILLAQGQIFILSASGKGFNYFSYFKTIPAVLGERLVFFPLGYVEHNPEGTAANIELDIQILSFESQVKENNK